MILLLLPPILLLLLHAASLFFLLLKVWFFGWEECKWRTKELNLPRPSACKDRLLFLISLPKWNKRWYFGSMDVLDNMSCFNSSNVHLSEMWIFFWKSIFSKWMNGWMDGWMNRVKSVNSNLSILWFWQVETRVESAWNTTQILNQILAR